MLKISIISGLSLFLLGGFVLVRVVGDVRSEEARVASCKLKYNSEPDEYLKQYTEWLKLSPEQRAGMPFEVNGYGQAKTKAEIEVAQRERLNADIDRLASGELEGHPYSEVLYGASWRERVREYSKRKERNEFFLTGSVVCTSIGGATVGLSFLYWLFQIVLGTVRRFGISDEDTERVETAEDSDFSDSAAVSNEEVSFVNSARAILGESHVEEDSEPAEADSEETKSEGRGRKKVAMLISEKKQTDKAAASEPKPAMGVGDMARSSGIGQSPQMSSAQEQRERAMLEESLKAHTLKLEKQMEEFRRMYNTRQSANEPSQPLNGTLEELTQQVSAIRAYAANQQQRVEKLQGGYDWNIIRTFCLRVIRCIDNLECRIERLSKQDVETAHLEEVRDELIFALESSGVEQFRPEENSPYRGQEKSTEAVKERERCCDSNQAGTIAKVVRPGYQYVIDEGNLKIVRSAQVKLYG